MVWYYVHHDVNTGWLEPRGIGVRSKEERREDLVSTVQGGQREDLGCMVQGGQREDLVCTVQGGQREDPVCGTIVAVEDPPSYCSWDQNPIRRTSWNGNFPNAVNTSEGPYVTVNRTRAVRR